MKLSVALCTYNGASYIEKQLLSILQQEVPINEIIICDDGSYDNTIQLINNFFRRHIFKNIYLIRNEIQLGVINNFEKAISLCSGDIIFLSDQDDIWLPQKTKEFITFFQQHPNVNLCFSDAYLIDEYDNIKSNWSLFDAVGLRDKIKIAWNKGLQFEITNILDNKVTGATIAFRSSFAKDTSFKLCIHQLHDAQLAISAIIDNSIGLLPLKLTKYRIHSTQTIGLKGNWVFKNSNPHNDFPALLEPIPIKEYWFEFKHNQQFENRIKFYTTRTKFYHTVIGKIKLTFLLPSYMKYYHYLGIYFYLNDITYGIKSFILKILSSKNQLQ